MGIPYSKEINKAFVELNNAYGQVTPLVAAAYEVLETTKNISLLVAGIQVLNSILLATILITMFALLITVNPALEKERDELVTPVLFWITGWAKFGRRVMSFFGFLLIMIAIGAVMLVRREGKGPVESVEEVEANVQEEQTDGKDKEK